jgi:4-amino-4-deoxy-L-arabinose transferase-like glycosyltransferase
VRPAGSEGAAARGPSPGAARRRGRWDALALALLAAWLACVHAAGAGLVDPDEARSALAARLMAERGDWLALHLPAVFHHDYPAYPQEGDLVAYWDKPPLFFWLVALAIRALGPTALAVRLPSALSHVAAVLLVWAAARRLWGRREGLLAGAVMAVAPLPLVMAHVARMEALLAALMTAMLVAALRLLGDRPRSWAWTAVLWGAAGLGVLAKGPVAVVLPAAAVVAALLVSGRLRDLGRLRPLAGLAILLAVAAPWFIYAHFRYPPGTEGGGFTQVFFVAQHLGRATTGEFGHRQPPGTLVGVFLAGLLPWTIFLPGLIRDLAVAGWRERRERPAVVLLLAWSLVVLGAFSLSTTQLPHYVVPAVPPVAILLGKYLADRTRPLDRNRLFGVGLWVTALAGVAAVVGLVLGLKHMGLWHSRYWGVAVVVAGFVGAGIAALVKRQRSAPVWLTVATMAALMTFVFSADPFAIYSTFTTRFEAHQLEKAMRPGDRLIAFPYTPYSLAWYLWPREVRYPTTVVEGKEVPSLPDLVAELQAPGRTFCLLHKKAALEILRREVGRPIEVLSERREHTLLVVGPPPGAAEAPHEP